MLLAPFNPAEADSSAQYYAQLSLQQKQSFDRQEIYLKTFAKLGRQYQAAETCDISVNTLEWWKSTDHHGFKKRLELAHQVNLEVWESVMDERLEKPQGNRGSDPLLMFKLKAMAPAKYREEVRVIDPGIAVQTLERLKALASGVQVPTVEGTLATDSVVPEPSDAGV